jgi:hypothetical protein
MSPTHRTIDAVAVRVAIIVLGLLLCGCTASVRREVVCVSADVALAVPVPGVALGGAVTGLAACR